MADAERGQCRLLGDVAERVDTVAPSCASVNVVVAANAATATCTFSPASTGTYTVSAAYSGTSDFEPSSGSVGVVVPIPTTTTLGVTGSGSGSNYSFSITATVTPTPSGTTPTGSVAFELTGGTCGSYGCAGTVTLSSGQATWSKSGLSKSSYGNNYTYTLQATFTDATGTYATSTANWSGPV